jgi:hypothetical protein
MQRNKVELLVRERTAMAIKRRKTEEKTGSCSSLKRLESDGGENTSTRDTRRRVRAQRDKNEHFKSRYPHIGLRGKERKKDNAISVLPPDSYRAICKTNAFF